MTGEYLVTGVHQLDRNVEILGANVDLPHGRRAREDHPATGPACRRIRKPSTPLTPGYADPANAPTPSSKAGKILRKIRTRPQYYATLLINAV